MKLTSANLAFVLLIVINGTAALATDRLAAPAQGTVCVGMNWGFGYGTSYVVNCNNAVTDTNEKTYLYQKGPFSSAQQDRANGLVTLKNAGYSTTELNVLRAEERQLYKKIDLVLSSDLLEKLNLANLDICVADGSLTDSLGGVYACSEGVVLTVENGHAKMDDFVKLATLNNKLGPQSQIVYTRAK